MQLGELVTEIRSKNAGPFWVTIDIFCGNNDVYENVSRSLATETVANLYKLPVAQLQRYNLPTLHVIKFSFPRPIVQGSQGDRDMHGAQYSLLLSEFTLG